MNGVVHTPWLGETPPSREELESLFRTEGLEPGWWSNGPGERYAAHAHAYHKVLYCYRGSISFAVVETGEAFDLKSGDRLDIPPGVCHSAMVGFGGVSCIEGYRS